jgi:tRNA-2-methylthio-N6-dimethylallyladenosine synthase
MAQNHAEHIFERAPQVNLVLGSAALESLPELIARLQSGRDSRCMNTELEAETFFRNREQPDGHADGNIHYPVFVSVMRGCDNRCTYCIVPYVRGREVYRPAEDIYSEVRALVEQGYVEVTLIGQTVNSYRFDGMDFADLLLEVERIPGLERVRFATSHPKDFTPRLIEAIAQGEKICEHVHLPAQSGSNRILRRMGRRYTVEQYVSICDGLREKVPGMSITTDLIAGFPGETEEDFQGTLDLMRRVGWEGGFLFKYSPRQGTPAARMTDTVPPDVAQERFERLLDLQLEVAGRANEKLVGSMVEILLEEVPHIDEAGCVQGECKGRTRSNRMVIADPGDLEAGVSSLRVGDQITVRINQARAYSLRGIIKDREAA